MAKVEKGKQLKKGKAGLTFSLEKENVVILGIGLVVIVMGYVALSGNVVEGFRQLTLAPLLLLLGYCVIIPVGIMYRKKPKADSAGKPSSGSPGNCPPAPATPARSGLCSRCEATPRDHTASE